MTAARGVDGRKNKGGNGKDESMRLCKIAICITCLGLLAGCGSPESRAARAQERSYDAMGEVAKERLRLVEQYQDCVVESAGDEQRIEACDSYLRAAEALK